MPSAFFLPNVKGIEVPSTIMRHIAPQLDPQAIILWGADANPQNARTVIEQYNPEYVFTTGHGIPCTTTLQNNQPFISLAVPQMNPKYCDRERNLDIWKGRVLHLHSCWCGKLLAPTLVDKYGAWAVFAHDDEFLFLLPPDGKTIDITIASPFLAEFSVDTAMLSGKSAGEAQQQRMAAYDKWIKYFQDGEGSHLRPAPLVVRILMADKMISKLYGDPTATVTGVGQAKSAKLNLPITIPGVKGINPIILAPLALWIISKR